MKHHNITVENCAYYSIQGVPCPYRLQVCTPACHEICSSHSNAEGLQPDTLMPKRFGLVRRETNTGCMTTKPRGHITGHVSDRFYVG